MSSFSKVFVHVVWATIGRRRLITPQVREQLLPYRAAKAAERECMVVESEAMPDHVHFAVRLHNTVALSRLVQELKGGSAHFINHRSADFHHHREPGAVAMARGTLYWQRGYGAFSFWERDARLVAAYIRTQQERHLKDRWLPFDVLVPDPRATVGSVANAIEDEAILINEWERANDEEDVWQGIRTPPS